MTPQNLLDRRRTVGRSRAPDRWSAPDVHGDLDGADGATREAGADGGLGVAGEGQGEHGGEGRQGGQDRQPGVEAGRRLRTRSGTVNSSGSDSAESLYRLSRLRNLGVEARSHTVGSSRSLVCATARSPP